MSLDAANRDGTRATSIEGRLPRLGLSLPPPLSPPAGVVLPFASVRIVGCRALVSGHGPQNPDGSLGTLDRTAAWTRVLDMAALPFGIPVEIEAEVELTAV